MSSRGGSNADRRRKGFKKTIDADDARRKREDNIIELRKAKRDESLQKKRATFMGATAGGAIEDSNRNNAMVQQKVGCDWLGTLLLQKVLLDAVLRLLACAA